MHVSSAVLRMLGFGLFCSQVDSWHQQGLFRAFGRACMRRVLDMDLDNNLGAVQNYACQCLPVRPKDPIPQHNVLSEINVWDAMV